MSFLIALFLTGLFSWLVLKSEDKMNSTGLLAVQVGGGAAMGSTWANALGFDSFGVSFFVAWAICFGFLYAVPTIAKRFM